jgi:hypothetical protein
VGAGSELTLFSLALLLFAGEVALVVRNIVVAARDARRSGGPGGAVG